MKWLFWFGSAALAGSILIAFVQFVLVLLLKPLQGFVGQTLVVFTAALFSVVIIAAAIGGAALALQITLWPALALWFSLQIVRDLAGIMEASARDGHAGLDRQDPKEALSSLTGTQIAFSAGHVAGYVVYFVF